MDNHESISKFIAEAFDYHNALNPGDDIFRAVGIEGADADDFVEEFAASFDVNMQSYLWYFHTVEEGVNLGGFIFGSPDQDVLRIPITLEVLSASIDAKAWTVQYPDHKIPAGRADLVFNAVLILGIFVIVLWTLLF